MTGCYRHPDREANIRCQRCDRPICPDCMQDASVGFHCPECVSAGNKSVRQPRTMAGGLIPTDAGRMAFALIAINVAVFIAQQVTPAVERAGVMYAGGIVRGEYWRMLTSEFLHASPLHLLLNMYALYLFGPAAERALGTARFLASYVTMAIAASAAVYLFSDPQNTTLGASGAIFGLFGLVLVLLIRAGQDVRFLFVLLAVNALFSLRGGISWQAHLGGFLAGVLLGVVFAYAPRASRTLWQGLAFGVIWAGIVAAVVVHTMALTSQITPM